MHDSIYVVMCHSMIDCVYEVRQWPFEKSLGQVRARKKTKGQVRVKGDQAWSCQRHRFPLTLTWPLFFFSVSHLFQRFFKRPLPDIINAVKHRVTHDNMYAVKHLILLYTLTLTWHLFFFQSHTAVFTA